MSNYLSFRPNHTKVIYEKTELCLTFQIRVSVFVSFRYKD